MHLTCMHNFTASMYYHTLPSLLGLAQYNVYRMSASHSIRNLVWVKLSNSCPTRARQCDVRTMSEHGHIDEEDHSVQSHITKTDLCICMHIQGSLMLQGSLEDGLS